jgi:Fe-S cluster assembly protein SufD
MSALALPTRRAEDWRYSDVEAAASVWPVPAPERIVLGPGEQGSQALLQDAADDAVVVRDYVITLAEGARLDFHLLNSGGRLGRVKFDVRLERGAHFGLHAGVIGGGEQTLEVVTTVSHAEPDATSEQVVRTVLGGRATGNYLGKIGVAKHAQGTDASQSVKAMLLSRQASANAKPELEIFADDVKCAHGCAIGELDKQALFYMAARGLDPATAQTLLLRAFVAGVFDGIADEAERERFEAAALAKLEGLA